MPKMVKMVPQLGNGLFATLPIIGTFYDQFGWSMTFWWGNAWEKTMARFSIVIFNWFYQKSCVQSGVIRKLGRKETNFAPKIAIHQPFSCICSSNSLSKPIWLWIALMFARLSYKFLDAWFNHIAFINFHRAWDLSVTRIWDIVLDKAGDDISSGSNLKKK